jgi:uncharacterized protein YbjT (DUF2867 family)
MDKSGKIILVTGATGNQGGATARHLLANGWQVRAATRDPNRAEAKALAEQGAELVQADFDDPESLTRAIEGVYGVFSVQNFWGIGAEAETRQGNALAGAAKAAGVQHFVYTSVGGAEKNTGIPHFDSKWRIEERIAALGLPATILRPVFFMENFGFMFREQIAAGQITFALEPNTPLQLIAVEDIGALAALVFEQPETYIGQAIEIAGDSLTMPQIAAQLSEVTGKKVEFVEQPLEQVRAFDHEMAVMLDWFNRVGYQADIPGLRQLRPQMLTLNQWLRQNGWERVGQAG